MYLLQLLKTALDDAAAAAQDERDAIDNGRWRLDEGLRERARASAARFKEELDAEIDLRVERKLEDWRMEGRL